MNWDLVNYYIELYKKDIGRIRTDQSANETYKWEAVKHFQDNFNFNSNAANFPEMLDCALAKTNNLLDSGNYFPKRMLLKNARNDSRAVRKLLLDLYDERNSICDRILIFKKKFRELNIMHFRGMKDYQDLRAITVYLALQYPERYYFYKHTVYYDFTRIMDCQYVPIRGHDEANIKEYTDLCNALKFTLESDHQLINLHRSYLDCDCYPDERNTILTQDFIFAVTTYLKREPIPKLTKKQKIVEIPYSSRNSLPPFRENFTASKKDYISEGIKNRRIGLWGECFIIKCIKQHLIDEGREDLIPNIIHTSDAEGDGPGYDIEFIEQGGNRIFIEVKTTTGDCASPFYVTRNELERSIIEREYFLCRVYNFCESERSGDIAYRKGSLHELCDTPDTFKVSIEM